MTTTSELSTPSNPTPERSESVLDDSALWVELEITVESSGDCPLAGLSDTPVDGHVQLTGSQCHMLLSAGGPGTEEVSVYNTTVHDCTCHKVCVPGFTPVDMSVAGGRLVLSGYVTDRERLATITDALNESDDTWRLRRLTAPDRSRGLRDSLDRGQFEDLSLTEKQRRTVRTAVEMGYYRTPRDASLGDLATELGVSRSALSQRLNAVESKLIKSLAAEL